MVNTSQINRPHNFEQSPVTIRALRSLTPQHADVVSQIVEHVSGRWVIELHDDYDGYLSILISPTETSRESYVYIVSGTIGHIEMSAMDGDNLHQLGCYETIDQAAVRLRNALAEGSPIRV